MKNEELIEIIRPFLYLIVVILTALIIAIFLTMIVSNELAKEKVICQEEVTEKIPLYYNIDNNETIYIYEDGNFMEVEILK